MTFFFRTFIKLNTPYCFILQLLLNRRIATPDYIGHLALLGWYPCLHNRDGKLWI